MKIGDLTQPVYQGQPNERITDYRQPMFQRSQPSGRFLYHGTSFVYMPAIFRDDALYDGAYWGKPNEPHGVRCSRTIEGARPFAFDTDFPLGAILVLKWNELSRDFGTTAYKDIDADGQYWKHNEEEEVVLTSVIKPLHHYLDHCLTNDSRFKLPDWAWEWVQEYSRAYKRKADYTRAFKKAIAYPRWRTI